LHSDGGVAVEGVAVSWSRNAKKMKHFLVKIAAIASGWQICLQRKRDIENKGEKERKETLHASTYNVSQEYDINPQLYHFRHGNLLDCPLERLNIFMPFRKR